MDVYRKDVMFFKRLIYKYVLNDLKSYGGLLVGKYDARNGNEHYMFGVSLVMEIIANLAGDDDFGEEFLHNMSLSEEESE